MEIKIITIGHYVYIETDNVIVSAQGVEFEIKKNDNEKPIITLITK